MEKLILTVATTGAIPGKNDSPFIPITPKEIAEEVLLCAQAGASIAHIHVRDDEGKGTIALDKFKEAVDIIRESGCNIVLNLTTSGGPGTHEERMRHLGALKPEMASFNAGTMNWAHSTVFMNEPAFLEKLGTCMKENNVKPEIEVFDGGMVYNSLYYLKKGILLDNPHFQFVLGAPGGLTATVKNLLFLLDIIPKNATWGAFGIGSAHLPILYASLALGATSVRVGMEDNLFYSKGVLAKSNVEFVERTIRIAKEFGREVATPDEARTILNLQNKPA